MWLFSDSSPLFLLPLPLFHHLNHVLHDILHGSHALPIAGAVGQRGHSGPGEAGRAVSHGPTAVLEEDTFFGSGVIWGGVHLLKEGKVGTGRVPEAGILALLEYMNSECLLTYHLNI